MNNTIAKIYNKIFDNDFCENTSLILLLFFTGLINSRRHIAMFKIPFLEVIIILIFGLLFVLNILMIIFKCFIYKESPYVTDKYWKPLIIIILLKYIIIFSQILYSFLINKLTSDVQTLSLAANYPINSHVNNLIKFIINFTMIAILTTRIDNFCKLNLSISAFGLGCAIAPIIGLIFFPNLIGRRISYVNGIFFAGSFWNASVIAFVSSGWLLISTLKNIEKPFGKFINLFLAVIMFVGGIAGLSRAIVVSGFISMLIYVICLKDIKKLFKIIAILIILVLIIQSQFGIIFENFKLRLQKKGDIRNEGRIKIWKDYLEDIKTFFILGEPVEGYKVFSKTGKGPHSILLNWWSQFGVFAVLAFIWFMCGVWKSASYIYKNMTIQQGAAIFAWLFGYLSLAMINETGYRELPFYAAMGIIFAWGNLVKRKTTMAN